MVVEFQLYCEPCEIERALLSLPDELLFPSHCFEIYIPFVSRSKKQTGIKKRSGKS